MEKSVRQCPRCRNRDPAYFYLGSKGWYCRKCITFSRFFLEAQEKENEEAQVIDTQYELPFSLSELQKSAARLIKDNYQNENILVYAACGAGKTELMLDFLVDAFARGYKVGWAIPRRSVVIQLAQRLSSYFPTLKVIAVCQGYTDNLLGDLIICTTHQLFRYYQYFDYLIIDEPDAFPFKNNELLQNIALSSVKKHLIFLTATPDEFVYQNSKRVVELFRRPHQQALDIPKVIHLPKLFAFIYLFIRLSLRKRKLIVFVPSIKEGKRLQAICKHLFNCLLITSASEKKEKILETFINTELGILFSTTVLERGITIANLDVIVFQADSAVFDVAALTQMAGRVGRVSEFPSGNIWFITTSSSQQVKKCIQLIKKMNNAV